MRWSFPRAGAAPVAYSISLLFKAVVSVIVFTPLHKAKNSRGKPCVLPKCFMIIRQICSKRLRGTLNNYTHLRLCQYCTFFFVYFYYDKSRRLNPFLKPNRRIFSCSSYVLTTLTFNVYSLFQITIKRK